MILAKSDGYGRWACFLCGAEGKGSTRAEVDQQVCQHAAQAHGRRFCNIAEVDDGCEPDDPDFWANPNERKWLMLATYTCMDFTEDELYAHPQWLPKQATTTITWNTQPRQRNPEGKINRLIRRMKHEAQAKAKKALRRTQYD
jgi:hypothetical protein